MPQHPKARLTRKQRLMGEIREQHPDWSEARVRREAGYSYAMTRSVPAHTISSDEALVRVRAERRDGMTREEGDDLARATLRELFAHDDIRARAKALELWPTLRALDVVDTDESTPTAALDWLRGVQREARLRGVRLALRRPGLVRRILERVQGTGEGPKAAGGLVIGQDDKI